MFPSEPSAIYFVGKPQTQNHFKFVIKSHPSILKKQWAYSLSRGETICWNDEHTGNFLMKNSQEAVGEDGTFVVSLSL